MRMTRPLHSARERARPRQWARRKDAYMATMPPSQREHPLFTIEEYLTLERAAEERHEYLNGCIYAMAGESPDHGRICVNLTRRLAEQLDGSRCEVFSQDL